MLVRDSDGSYEAIDFREKAPAAAFRDMYKHDRLASVFGGLAAGVPGEVRGLAHLHENYGVSCGHFISPLNSANAMIGSFLARSCQPGR